MCGAAMRWQDGRRSRAARDQDREFEADPTAGFIGNSWNPVITTRHNLSRSAHHVVRTQGNPARTTFSLTRTRGADLQASLGPGAARADRAECLAGARMPRRRVLPSWKALPSRAVDRPRREPTLTVSRSPALRLLAPGRLRQTDHRDQRQRTSTLFSRAPGAGPAGERPIRRGPNDCPLRWNRTRRRQDSATATGRGTVRGRTMAGTSTAESWA